MEEELKEANIIWITVKKEQPRTESAGAALSSPCVFHQERNDVTNYRLMSGMKQYYNQLKIKHITFLADANVPGHSSDQCIAHYTELTANCDTLRCDTLRCLRH